MIEKCQTIGLIEPIVGKCYLKKDINVLTTFGRLSYVTGVYRIKLLVKLWTKILDRCIHSLKRSPLT